MPQRPFPPSLAVTFPPSQQSTSSPSPIQIHPGGSSGSARANIVIFSGGSAANSLVDVFEQLRAGHGCGLSYVLPISDNGGSTSEIIRVFGGPGIGDVRSRLVRLIPVHAAESAALRQLFEYRLPAGPRGAARAEWLDLLDGRHALWAAVSAARRELVRALLNHFNLEAVKRARPTSRFDFSRASIGNLFLTGARLFTGSLEAAIYLLGSVCAVPDHVAVLPALDTNFAHHIAAGLADGSVVVGQSDISHPPAPPAALHPDQDQDREDANLPGTLSALRRPMLVVSKDHDAHAALPARIRRVWYINPYGHEMRPAANPRVLRALTTAAAVVFSIGSLFTSIVPSLVLRGVGPALADPAIRRKVLILNGCSDRETGPPADPMTALDFVAAIAAACADPAHSAAAPSPSPAPPTAVPESELGRYVSHLIYLDSPCSPRVDRTRLATAGIEPVRLYAPPQQPGRYDQTALLQALEAIIGRDISVNRRRNTLAG